MADFVFRVSPNVIIASYSASRIGQFAMEYGKRFMLVMDPVLRSVGLADKIVKPLADHDIDYFVFDELGESADTKTADAALNLARASHVQGVIAVGGGKAAGIARAAAAFFSGNGDIYSFVDGQEDTPLNPLPLISLCTTCRDPYLFTDRVPLADSRSNKLRFLKAPNGLCKAAVFDPNLFVTLTENQMQSMALESLCFAAESYLSQKANFFSDMLAEKSAQLIHLALDGSESLSIAAPKEELMAQGGAMASIAASASSFGPAGLLALAVNARLRINRALIASILFPYVIEDCAKFKAEKVAAFARSFGLAAQSDTEAALSLAENIRQRMAKTNLPTRLKDLSISMEQIALAAEDAGNSEYMTSLPRSMTSDDLFELAKAAF